MRFEVSDLANLLRVYFPVFGWNIEGCQIGQTDPLIREGNKNIWDIEGNTYLGNIPMSDPSYSMVSYQEWDEWESVDRYLKSLREFYNGEEPVLNERESQNKTILALLHKHGIDRAGVVKGMTFYTICPLKRMPYTPESLRALNDFCVEIFVQKAKSNFIDNWWVIESGKNKDEPNLHIHVLANFVNKHNFRRDLKATWSRHFGSDPGNDILYRNYCKKKQRWNKGIDARACNTKLIQQDKIKYMLNSEKGSHENFTDLGLSGEWHIAQSEV